MMRVTGCVVVLGMALAVSCGGGSRPAEKVAPAITAIPNTWDRSRQCAEQAERMVRFNGFLDGKSVDGLRPMSWTNHYSPTFQRCFVKVMFSNLNAKTDKEQQRFFYSLFDVFENREIASCTDANNAAAKAFCSFEGQGADSTCADCRRFVQARTHD